jgi:hypothetical protein
VATDQLVERLPIAVLRALDEVGVEGVIMEQVLHGVCHR